MAYIIFIQSASDTQSQHSFDPMDSLVHSPSMVSSYDVASVIARPVLLIITTGAMHICMTKPNPPPSKSDRKNASSVENASQDLLRPFMTCFSLTPAFIELTTALIWLAAPAPYDIVRGTCAARISYSTFAVVACVLSLCGMGIRLWCYRALGPFFTFELAVLPGHKLITTGPYAIVRHPAYTGGLLALVGMALANISRGSWVYECGIASSWWGIGWGMLAGISTIIMVERCGREDRFLREAFGAEWDAWGAQVRWRMVPWVY